MVFMINSITHFCQSHYDQIPADTFKSACIGAMISFTVSQLMIELRAPNQMPNLARPAIAAGVSFIAGVIHGLVTPIFNYLFDNSTNQYHPWQEILKISITVSLAHVLVNTSTVYKVNLMTSNFPFLNDNYLVLVSNMMRLAYDLGDNMFGFLPWFRNSLQNLGVNFTGNPNPYYIIG